MRDCGMTMTNAGAPTPPPTPLADWDLYWRERWRRRASWLDAAIADGEPPGYAWLNAAHHAALLPRDRFPRLLDAACGLGLGVALLAERGYRCDGADGSATAVAIAREFLSSRTVIATVEQCGWDALPARWPGAHNYDAVLCDALLWSPTEQALRVALRGLRALLRPGGWLVFQGVTPGQDAAANARHRHEAHARAIDGERHPAPLRHTVRHRVEGHALLEEHTFATEAGTNATATIARRFAFDWNTVRTASLAAGFSDLRSEARTVRGELRRHAVAVASPHDGA